MLITISTSHSPATDLGFLLHKNPVRLHSFEMPFGTAHVFYTEASDRRCTAVLLMDVDPIELVRGKHFEEGLAQYVSDRPYVASSFMSVAIGTVFGTAMGGRSRERPELAQTPIPLEATISVVSWSGEPQTIRDLFEPLGYAVELEGHEVRIAGSDSSETTHYTVRLSAEVRLCDLLNHLYVLITTLDNKKHYFIGSDEVDKLIRKGEGWLKLHPKREIIVGRYLRHRSSLMREATARLLDEEDPEREAHELSNDTEEEAIEKRVSLHEQRLGSVLAVLSESEACRVMDLGCGEGRLIGLLLKDKRFTQILGMDVSYSSLQRAQSRLRLERLPPMQRERLQLIQGALTYRDSRLSGYDAAAVVEVIEHLDTARLQAFERVLFEFARPATVVVTTPNFEYNPKFEGLAAGSFRHKDHRFEWTRAQFEEWSSDVGSRFGYSVRCLPIGPNDAQVGSPSQMAVFTLLANTGIGLQDLQ